MAITEERYQIVPSMYAIGIDLGIGTFQHPDFLSIVFGPSMPSKLVRTNEDIHAAVELWCKDLTEAEWKYGHVSMWNVRNVSDMGGLFSGNTTFNGDLNSWDVSPVTNMEYMFYGGAAFNGDLSSWDVSAVTNLRNMFHNCPIEEANMPQAGRH